jgi:hypothetical protein
MNRTTVKITAALLTFIIGVAAAALWLVSPRSPEEDTTPAPLPYCEVARNPGQYHDQVIRVRATLSFGSGGMYVVDDCDPVSALSSLVEIDGSEGTFPKARNYVDEMLTDQTEVQIRKVEVIITGRFNGEFSNGCHLPSYHIAAQNIQVVSP